MKIKYNYKNIELISEYAKEALIETAEAVKTDLIQSQTMPFDTGTMQNDSTFIDDKESNKGRVYIISDTPYARRLYFHPEYQFNKQKNPNAQARWFDTYVVGEKKQYVIGLFEKFYKRRLK